jgi:hypothetical protein
MGRPKKPTAALLTAGSFDKNPQRAQGRGNDATPTEGLQSMPDYLSEAEKRCWSTIIDQCTPGVLKKSDWIGVLAMTRLLAKLEAGTIIAPEHSQLRAYLVEFAMTPKARPGVQIPKAPNANEFSTI